MSQDNAGSSNLVIPVVVQTALDLKKNTITPITATTKGTATKVSVVEVNAQGDVVNLTEVVIQIPASQITDINTYIKNLFATSGIFINSDTIEIVNSLPDPFLRIKANSITYSDLATALQTLIDSKAPLESPALTGIPTTTTAPVGTDTTRISSCAFVRAEISTMIASLDVQIYKGVLNASTNPNYPLADSGNAYRISVSGKIGGASGINVEVGDLLMCLVDGSVAGNQATVGMNWSIIQVNIDGAVVGIDSVSTDNDFVVFSGTSGRIIKKITQGSFKTLLALAKADVGLANVDNTSDVSKPISTATQTAINLKQNTLTSTGVSAGTYGNSNNIPSFTVDSLGRMTTASNVALPMQNLQDMSIQLGISGASYAEYVINFSPAFTVIPKIQATISGALNSGPYNEIFVLTIKVTTLTNITMIVKRIDADAGWGQLLQLYMLAYN